MKMSNARYLKFKVDESQFTFSSIKERAKTIATEYGIHVDPNEVYNIYNSIVKSGVLSDEDKDVAEPISFIVYMKLNNDLTCTWCVADAFAKLWKLDSATISSYYDKVAVALGIAKHVQTYEERLHGFVKLLGLPEEVENEVLEFLDRHGDKMRVFSERHMNAVIAALVLLFAKKRGYKVSQAKLTELFDISPTHLREYVNEFKKYIDVEQTLQQKHVTLDNYLEERAKYIGGGQILGHV